LCWILEVYCSHKQTFSHSKIVSGALDLGFGRGTKAGRGKLEFVMGLGKNSRIRVHEN